MSDLLKNAEIACSVHRLRKPAITFTAAQWVNQSACDDHINVYVYNDGSYELGKCSRDGEVFTAFQIGATNNQ